MSAGAFTGAQQSVKGKLELADSDTLFLAKSRK
jgi:transcriptional regulator with GAF, ATPase, and Fis domain